MKAVENAIKFTRRDSENIFWIWLISIIVAFFIGVLILEIITEDTDEMVFFKYLFAFLGIVIFVLSGALYTHYQRYRTILNIKNGNHYLYWKYENGDELVIAKKIILRHSIEKIISKTSTKFEGFKWGIENLKNAMDDLKAGGLPISLIIPSLKISTKSNKIPPLIDLFKMNTVVNMSLVELDSIKVLMIDIERDLKGKELISMLYPVPKEVKFSDNSFHNLVEKMAKDINVIYGIIDEKVLAQIDDMEN